MKKTSKKRLNRVKVVRGFGRGKRIGIPTVNFDPRAVQDLEHGIYVCCVFTPKEYWGVMHFGPCPTFDEEEPSLEVHIFDYDGVSSMSDEMDIEVHGFIRKIMKFGSVEEMLKMIEKDILEAKKILKILKNVDGNQNCLDE